MNDAIEKRFAGVSPTVFQQSVGGPIFHGNTFHVAWARPKNLPKGPPPPASIGHIEAPDAKTVLVGRFLGESLPPIPR